MIVVAQPLLKNCICRIHRLEQRAIDWKTSQRIIKHFLYGSFELVETFETIVVQL